MQKIEMSTDGLLHVIEIVKKIPLTKTCMNVSWGIELLSNDLAKSKLYLTLQFVS